MEEKINRNTPLWDRSLPVDERIDWLLSHMSIDEKFQSLTSRGIYSEGAQVRISSLGGEAAHGVQGRNDQGEVSPPDHTTSFPQPIGFGATWDRQVLKEAGRVVGVEARVVEKRKPYSGGLCRWAPTIDLERDPRWGRNEEAYGEDPLLTGETAGAYVEGMRGEDPFYIRCAALLKHFYANNTEDGRGWKNATITPRNRYELYLEPFRRVLKHGAVGVMTAYNKINGKPGILNPEVRKILKEQYGATYTVGDGGAMALVKNLHHYYGNHFDTLTAALAAGVDGMLDRPDQVYEAAKEAYDLGILTEQAIDEAIRSAMRIRIRLGLYDREPGCPYDKVTEADINSAENQKVSLQTALEAFVLLKNEKGLLPLEADERPALIGPISDIWYQDWYCGEPLYKKTLKEGLEDVTGTPFTAVDGYDRVIFHVGDRPVSMDDNGRLYLGQTPERFILMDWGCGNYTLRSERTGLFWQTCLPSTSGQQLNNGDPGSVVCTRTAPFDWFVMERFFLEEHEDGTVSLISRFHAPVGIDADEGLRVNLEDPDDPGVPFTMQIVEDGAAKAAQEAAKASKVILAVGCCPTINAKEEIDRSTLALPPQQENLIRAVLKANPRTILVMLCNYPYTMNGLEKELPAILWSATGSQDMGTAAAKVLYGQYAPAGRLNMTWYQSDDPLPDINDYDIIRGKRTYRYFDGEVMYPFGYGCSYTEFAYSDLKVTAEDVNVFRVEFDVRNTGTLTSDEVVQVYACPPASRVPKPLRQLVAFDRLKEIHPGETRHVTLSFRSDELRFYDTIGGKLMVETGDYEIFAGRSCLDPVLKTTVRIFGETTGTRDLGRRLKADHFDEYENLELVEGAYDLTAAAPLDPGKPLVLTYRDSLFPEEPSQCRLLLTCEENITAQIYADDALIGEFKGATSSWVEQTQFRENSLNEGTPRPTRWKAVWTDVAVPLTKKPDSTKPSALTLKISGPVKLLAIRFV